MQNVAEGKKQYSAPSIAVIGAISEETKTGISWHKKFGPGDQWFMTDNCLVVEGKWDYTNCEATSA